MAASRSPCRRARSRTTTRGSATTPCGRSTTTSSCRRASAAAGTTATAGSTTGSPRWPPSVAAQGATVWVHDYQLQLVPAMLRTLRPDLRIGWFNHIPFPPVELFAQIPWRRELVEGLLGADLLGFQRPSDAQNFLRVVRRLLDLHVKGDHVTRAAPAATDTSGTSARRRSPSRSTPPGLEALARTPEVVERARQIREDLGNPEHLLLGIDRLDYTKGIRHRLKAFQELLVRRRGQPAGDGAGAGGDAEPRAGRGLPRAARPGRGHGRADQRRGGPDRHARRALPAPQLPQARRWRRSTWPPTSCS